MKGFNIYGHHFAKIFDEFWKDFNQSVGPNLIEFLKTTIKRQENNKVIDLFCGTGRLIKLLAEEAYHVLGIDRSQDMLNIAKQRLHQYIKENTVQLIREEATKFTVDVKVAAIISTFDSINHLSNLAEVKLCFQQVYDALDKEGLFIFDINTLKGLKNWNFVDLDESEDGATIFITHGKFDEKTLQAYSRVTGFIQQNDGCYHRFDELMYNTVFEVREIKNQLIACGFDKILFLYDYDLSREIKGDPEKQSRIFIVARKPV